MHVPWSRPIAASSLRTLRSACHQTLEDRVRAEKSSWEQVSEPDWSSCEMMPETPGSHWMWRRKQWSRTMRVATPESRGSHWTASGGSWVDKSWASGQPFCLNGLHIKSTEKRDEQEQRLRCSSSDCKNAPFQFASWVPYSRPAPLAENLALQPPFPANLLSQSFHIGWSTSVTRVHWCSRTIKCGLSCKMSLKPIHWHLWSL